MVAGELQPISAAFGREAKSWTGHQPIAGHIKTNKHSHSQLKDDLVFSEADMYVFGILEEAGVNA